MTGETIMVPRERLSAEEAAAAYRGIGTRTNVHTGVTADFVHPAFGKIMHHKGFDPRVISVLAEVYEKATLGWSEPVNEAHKMHPNFTGYSHYIAKLDIDGKEYYARLTLEDLKVGKKKLTATSQFHSIFISHAELYNVSGPGVIPKIIPWARPEPDCVIDSKLAQFLGCAATP
jgi:hypothetical protein